MRLYSIYGLVAVAALFLSGCEEKTAVQKEIIRPVRSVVVGDAAILQQRSFTGRAKASVELDLAFNVSGPLISRPVIVGQEVKAGTLVARIDPDRFKTDHDQNLATLARVKATLKNAELSLERDVVLHKKGHIAQARLDRTIARTDESRADVKSSEANANRSKIELDYTRLKAPFDGVIVQTYVENYENVQAKQSIVRIVDHAKIEMVIDIPEDLISLASTVKDVFVVYDTFPNVEVPAKVIKIGAEASQNTRTFPVTLIMKQPENVRILPGMAGRAFSKSSTTVAPGGGLEVPVSALLKVAGENQDYVWKVDEGNNAVTRIAVTLGALTDHGIIISDGITKGDRIVTAGVNYLKEGQKVALDNLEAGK